MPKIIKAVIVEDDVRHQTELMEMLVLSSFNIEILATCSNVRTATQAVLKYLPDLVFLDIELENGENGFDFLRNIENPKFGLILTTAALQISRMDVEVADKICCVRHLFKPFSLSDVESKLLDFAENSILNALRVSGLRKNILENNNMKVIAIGNNVIAIDEVVYIESNGELSNFYIKQPMNTLKRIVGDSRIGNYERILTQWNFIRTHKKFMVNIKHILKVDLKNYQRGITVYGEVSLAVARERRKEIGEILSK